jgi:hypothetical protein
LPHAWIVYDARQTTRDEALVLLSDGIVDPRKTVLLERSVADYDAPDDIAGDRIEFARYDPDRIDLRVQATAAGMLVMSEVFDSGWRAHVDGNPVSIHAADGVLRALPIPAGDHRVTMRYEPTSLRYGVLISLMAAVAMALVWGALCVRELTRWRQSRRVDDRRPEETQG